jgi:four helix bundle suffix protein
MAHPKDNRTNRTHQTDSDTHRPSHPSHPSCPSPASVEKGFIPAHGGYENLLSFRKARIVYDATVCFCRRFVDKHSRTTDQMIQAARSGKQNILEGSRASGTSKETELKLTNVARASLEELLEDYRDFLRTAREPIWDKESKESRFVRKLGNSPQVSFEDFREFLETRPSPVTANIIVSLIHQTNYLLDQQIRRLEKDFLKEGGLRERMTRARLSARSRPPKN